MTQKDLVQEAIEELYGIDPDGFTDQRNARAADARASGMKAAASEIAALRKPTRAAYALNTLVRSDPESVVRLTKLGSSLRAAQESLDGPQMRELSTLRRGMVEEFADRAFDLSGQGAPASGLREEVVSTLNAAVADQSVSEQLATGTLVRATRWDGFGFTSPPELSVVRPTAVGFQESAAHAGSATRVPARRARTAAPATTTGGAGSRSIPAKTPKPTTDAVARAEAKAKARAEEMRQQQIRAEARRRLADADSALAKAIKAEEKQENQVRMLHEQLTDARRRFDEIRLDLRRAENRQRKAQQALERGAK